MRLVTFVASGQQRIGALVDGDRRIVDFLAARTTPVPLSHSMQALIEAGPAALDRAREIVAERAAKRARHDRHRVSQAVVAAAGAAANA